MADIDTPTAEGRQLIKTWIDAKQEAERRRDALYRAQADLSAAENALIGWMLPPAIKAKPGEKISIWAGDSLLQVEVGGVESWDGPVCQRTSDQLTVRYRGKHFNER